MIFQNGRGVAFLLTFSIVLLSAAPALAGMGDTFAYIGVTPQTIGGLLLASLPLLAPLVVAGLVKLFGYVPPVLKPIIAIVAGSLIDVLASLLTGVAGNGWGAVMLATASIGIREVLDQMKKAIKGAI